MAHESIRVLKDAPLSGPANMARDEALLGSVGSGASEATLRLYRWADPTISLGYFQSAADVKALASPVCDLPVVRRLTGGGAILHDLELTYALALPVGHVLLGDGNSALYDLVHEAVIASLASFGASAHLAGFTDDSTAGRGPFFCFARRHRSDVLIGGDKIAGSAQRRTRHAVLQHGSIVVGNRFAQQPTAQLPVAFAETIGPLSIRFVSELSDVTGLAHVDGSWRAEELDAAELLIGKYSGDEWTRRK